MFKEHRNKNRKREQINRIAITPYLKLFDKFKEE